MDIKVVNNKSVCSFLKHSVLNVGLSLGLSLSFLETAFAWGQHGHAVICEMAYDQLTPKTRQEVDQLMKVHADDERLNTAFAWADRAPRKKPPNIM